MEIKTEKTDIVKRTVAYSLRIIKFFKTLSKDSASQILAKQLLCAGTSIGANVHEAQAAQSKADFISKMSIAYKETREALYWLRLIKESNTECALRGFLMNWLMKLVN